MGETSSPVRSEAEQVARKQASNSVLRVLDLIDVLAYRGGPFTLSELSQLLGWSAPTVHRFLRSLQLRDYVENIDGRYRLTLKLYDIGTTVADNVDLLGEARWACEDLCRDLGETVNVALRAGMSAIHVLFKSEAPDSIRAYPRPGMNVPLHCTALGKVLLAYAEPVTREELLDRLDFEPRTRHTITDRNVLERELELIVRRGWAVDEEENDDGLACVAAPVFERFGSVSAAISVTAPVARLPKRERPTTAKRVVKAADLISERVGYRPNGRR
jgi:DNA-binding IclR family transcriptional regulator